MRNTLFSFLLVTISLFANCQKNSNIQALIEGYKPHDTIPIVEFLKTTELSLDNKDYTIASFTTTVMIQGYANSVASKSNKITDETKKLFENLKKNKLKINTIYFEDITILSPINEELKIKTLVCFIRMD